ncbi:hypothetical protein GALL_460970 [mine drainage metagenome]|uniref:Uncharacterized protein n=1 Tax=mine drainage metagenome TaxID=410659 RepID=A0A1J5Q8I9_9ZZZZ
MMSSSELATGSGSGTRRAMCTTNHSDSITASRITAPLARIFAMAISLGRTGITSKCSMVPCSRSRIRAAPVRIIDNMVMTVMSSLMAPNQLLLSCGLKRLRRTRSIGSGAAARVRARNSLTSPVTMDWM